MMISEKVLDGGDENYDEVDAKEDLMSGIEGLGWW